LRLRKTGKACLGHEGSRPGISRTEMKQDRKEIGQEGSRTGSKYDRKKGNDRTGRKRTGKKQDRKKA
jgi:hypothetical protein